MYILFLKFKNREILDKIIYLYIKILKSNIYSNLIFSILEGLSKYSFLINIDLLYDLLNFLKILLEEFNQLKDLNIILKILITTSKLRLGLGQSINIDFNYFYNKLF